MSEKSSVAATPATLPPNAGYRGSQGFALKLAAATPPAVQTGLREQVRQGSALISQTYIAALLCSHTQQHVEQGVANLPLSIEAELIAHGSRKQS